MHIDPVLNAAFGVLNGSMLLCLLIVITVGRRKLRRRRSRKAGVVTLLTDPRHCVQFFKHIDRPCQGMTLPAPEDWQAAPLTPRVFSGFTLIIGVIIAIHLALFIVASLIP